MAYFPPIIALEALIVQSQKALKLTFGTSPWTNTSHRMQHATTPSKTLMQEPSLMAKLESTATLKLATRIAHAGTSVALHAKVTVLQPLVQVLVSLLP